MMDTPLVRVENLVKDYVLPKKYLLRKAPVYRALHGINLTVSPGASLGIVGESGCGKSTLARIVMALDRPSQGTVYFRDQDLFQLSVPKLKRLRRHFQMVFQDPYGSLNPRQNILKIVAEPLGTLEERIGTGEIKDRVCRTLREVGLSANDIDKYPHEFSGGQRQRIAIARALITRPSLIVADESVSALDVSVRAQVLNLMMDLQDKYGMAYMFISHDLSVVEYLTDTIAVIYLGKIVEQGRTDAVFHDPRHPYTRTLMAAIPDINPLNKRKKKIRPVIDPDVPEQGCPFRNRCQLASAVCQAVDPNLADKGGQLVACHNV